MVSISSKSEIKKRTQKFLELHIQSFKFEKVQLELLKEHLTDEYDLIPDKERVGKGMIYIVKIVAEVLYNHIKQKNSQPSESQQQIITLIEKFERDPELIRLAIHLAANLADDSFENISGKIETWALNEEWEIQENACHPIMRGLKKWRNAMLCKLREWVHHEDERLRRLVSESLRPKSEIKWLRDPTQNTEVLEILTVLNHDPSIYVRKSVGNNLKDLTKYMPETILDLIEDWLTIKDELGVQEQKNLMWTIYHALRWLK
ncbi:MAG: DNA alkylation repair protein, partial [Candidatus Helarchaeota archaeon]